MRNASQPGLRSTARGTASDHPPSAREREPWAWRPTHACWGSDPCTYTTRRATTSIAAFSCRGSLAHCRPGYT
eukprot:1238915-Lingulodinium_polyedra.AAC.1